jgi:hypothetical protein
MNWGVCGEGQGRGLTRAPSPLAGMRCGGGGWEEEEVAAAVVWCVWGGVGGRGV